MRLSNLEIIGFKSFSSRLKVKFSDGITAVVGPNGCGKSNIVDAIRWALGEHRATSLRGDRMEDVIFNGTDARKPLGMAEVSLTIDNNEQKLPIEYSDVTITRRYFRSGTSEYFINKEPCRLKDITNLLLDTGMGAHAYSIIEQGMVESVVNGSPQERRQLIEEAAGINKYKTRRRLAQRKLEGTEHDLVRIADLLEEVDRSASSLRRQVRKYERYDQLMQEMKEIEITISYHKFLHLRQQREPVQSTINTLGEQKETLLTRIRTAEAEVEKRNVNLLEKENDLQQKQDTVNRIDSQIRELNEELLVSRERRTGLENREKNAAEEAEVAKSEQRQVKIQLEDIDKNRKTIYNGLDQARTNFTERENLAKKFEEKISTQKESTMALRNRSMELIQKQSHEEAEINALTTHTESLDKRRSDLLANRNSLDEEIKSKTTTIETVNDKLEKTRKVVKENTSLNLNLLESIKKIKTSVESSRENLSSNETALATAEKEWALLDRMYQQFEGYSQGVRTLLTKTTETPDFLGVLADQIVIQKKYEPVIAAYLSGKLQYIIAGREEDALTGINFLREDDSGQASFILLGKLKSRRVPSELPFEDPGIIGRASAFVTTSENFYPIVNHLLSRVILVEDLETGFRLSALFDIDQGWKLLTANGEIIDPAGILTGGSVVENESDLLRRTERLENLNKNIETYRSEHNKIMKDIENLSTELNGLVGRQSKTEQFLNQSQHKMMELENRSRQYRFELSRFNEQDEKIELEVESLTQQIILAEEEYQKRKADLITLTENRVSSEDTLQEQQEILDELEGERQQLAEAAHDARIALVSLESRNNELSTTEEFLSQEDNRLKNVFQKREFEATEARKETKSLKVIQEKHETQLETLYLSRREREVDRDSVLEEHREMQEDLRQIQQSEGENRNAIAEVQEQIHKAELEEAELDMKSDEIRRQLLEKYDTDPDKIDEEPQVLDLESYASDAAESLQVDLQRKADELGPINMAAVEEYKAAKERLDFLQQQQTDLIEAKENLEKTIVKMNKAARTRFMNTFEQVRENFMTTFQTLFEGGEANLKLEEGDSLEAGIEIMARPEGKRLQSLALLSGGETALTAIALLFAIYLVKPSPFCVFDEVDAPLDDANVQRFASALQQFTNTTQFLVVTHNKRTMEAADYLYGITMEEPGLSKMVSVRLENTQSEKLEPAVTQE